MGISYDPPSEAVLQSELHDSCRTSTYDLPERVAGNAQGRIRKIGTIEHVLRLNSEFYAVPLFDREQSRQARVKDQSPWAANRTRSHICLGAGGWMRECRRIEPVSGRAGPRQSVAVNVQKH